MKMKTAIYLSACIIYLTARICTGQNLIPNPSFEHYTHCGHPQNFNFAIPWVATSNSFPVSSPDFLHTCMLDSNTAGSYVTMINTYHGRTGSGYAGGIMADTVNCCIERIEVPLIEALQRGRCYTIRIWLVTINPLIMGGNPITPLIVQEIGAFFSRDTIITNNSDTFYLVTPQFENQTVFIPYSDSWQCIQGNFVAEGGERFLIIGTFRPFNSLTISNPSGLPGRWSYYLFDDISVYECNTAGEKANAGDDREICYGESTRIGSTDHPEYLYHWTATDGAQYESGTPVVKPEVSTTYYLRQKDFKFDETIDSVTIYVRRCDTLMVPNVFTPNGDQFNDCLVISNPYSLTYTIDIFNRWGNRVFTTDQNKMWCGELQTLPGQSGCNHAPDGVYYYYIKSAGLDGRPLQYKGVVHLIR